MTGVELGVNLSKGCSHNTKYAKLQYLLTQRTTSPPLYCKEGGGILITTSDLRASVYTTATSQWAYTTLSRKHI